MYAEVDEGICCGFLVAIARLQSTQMSINKGLVKWTVSVRWHSLIVKVWALSQHT